MYLHDLNFFDKPLVATRELIASLVKSIVSDYEDSEPMFSTKRRDKDEMFSEKQESRTLENDYIPVVSESCGEEEYARFSIESERRCLKREDHHAQEPMMMLPEDECQEEYFDEYLEDEEEDSEEEARAPGAFIPEEDHAIHLEYTEPSPFHMAFHDKAMGIRKPSPTCPSLAGGHADELDEDDIMLQHKRNELMNSITQLVLKYYRDCHEMPSPEDIANGLKGKLVIKDDGDEPSALVVNSRLQIVLPDYNEMVVKMSPVTKTLYILFLRHPEGIVLKELADYRSEIEDIYCLVQPGRTERLMNETIDNLLDVTSGRVVQIISRIKRVFCTLILDHSLASMYIIAGERGGRFSIALAHDKIVLPKILQ